MIRNLSLTNFLKKMLILFFCFSTWKHILHKFHGSLMIKVVIFKVLKIDLKQYFLAIKNFYLKQKIKYFLKYLNFLDIKQSNLFSNPKYTHRLYFNILQFFLRYQNINLLSKKLKHVLIFFVKFFPNCRKPWKLS